MSCYSPLSERHKESFFVNLYGEKKIINYSPNLQKVFLFLELLINKKDWNAYDIETI